MNRKKQKLSLRKDEIQTQSQVEEMVVLRQKIMSMKAEMKLKNEEKDHLVKRVTSLEQELAKKESQLKLKDEEKEHLMERVASLEQELIVKDTELKLKNIEQEHLEKRVTSLEKELKKKETQLQLIKEPFEALPNEVIVEIFKHLALNELGKIARVCQRWNELSRSTVLWQNVNVGFYKFRNDMLISFINSLPCNPTSITVHFSDTTNWIQPLDFQEFCVALHAKSSDLQKLILFRTKLSNCHPSVVDLCSQFLPKLTSLFLLFPKCLEYTARVRCTHTSKITVLDATGSYMEQFSKPLFSRMRCLKELYLSCTNIKDSWFNNGISFLNQIEVLHLGGTSVGYRAFRAIKNHGLNLKELYMCCAQLDDNDLNFHISTFPRLNTICLKWCDNVTQEGVVSFVQSCPSLQDIYVNDDVALSYKIHYFVVANPCKLGTVKTIADCVEHDKEYY